jgi:hypothetical protein
VTVRASRLDPEIAVSIEPTTPTERIDLFVRACGRSERASKILALLVLGLDPARSPTSCSCPTTPLTTL